MDFAAQDNSCSTKTPPTRHTTQATYATSTGGYGATRTNPYKNRPKVTPPTDNEDMDEDEEEKKPPSKQGTNHYKQAKEVQDKRIAIIERQMAAMQTIQETTSTEVKMIIKIDKETGARNHDTMTRCMESFQQEYRGTKDKMYEQLDLMKERMDKKEAEEAKEKAPCGSPARKIPRPAAPTKKINSHQTD